MKNLLQILAFVAGMFCAHAQTPYAIPNNRRPPSWQPNASDGTGVRGGIVNRTHLINVTLSPYFADNTGATDCTSALQAAIAAAVAVGDNNQVVYLPTGTYKHVGITVPSNITIRGDGIGNPGDAGLTVSKSTTSTDFVIGQGETWNSTPTAVTGGLARGSTAITVSSATGFQAGHFARLYLNNDPSPSFPVFEVFGLQSQVRFFDMLVTNVSGSTISVSPSLPQDFSVAATLVPSGISLAVTTGVGIEGIYSDGSLGTPKFASIYFPGLAHDCWLKGVKIKNQHNYGVLATGTIFCEINHCRIEDADSFGTNHAGINFGEARNLLVVDSIIVKNQPNVEGNTGAVGCAFLYDYIDMGYFNLNWDGNHSGWTSHNLVESCYTPSILMDNYFSGSSQNTYHRNYVTAVPNDGVSPTQAFAVSDNAFERLDNLLGNIFLDAAHDWSSYTDRGVSLGKPFGGQVFGTAQLSLGVPWNGYDTTTHTTRVWTGTMASSTNTSGVITLDAGMATGIAWQLAHGNPLNTFSTKNGIQTATATSLSGVTLAYNGSFASYDGTNPPGNPPPGTAMLIVPGVSGFPELDLDVAATTIQLANFDFYNNAIPSDQAFPIGTSLANSYAYTSTPQFFTDAGLAWPPYDPANALGASIGSIPAGALFLFTVPPQIQGASIDTSGLVISVPVNKNVFVGAGGATTGWTMSASGMTFIFDRINGSTIIGHPSRAIFQGEAINLSYSSVLNGIEDANGNDLASRSAFHIINLSTNTGGKTVTWATAPNQKNAAYAFPFPGYASVSPVTLTRSGIIDNVTLLTDGLSSGGNMKVGVYDSTLHLLGGIEKPVNTAGEVFLFNLSSFHVPAGLYYVAIESANNNSPLMAIKSGAPTNASFLNDTPYAAFPPATITLLSGLGKGFIIGLELIPDSGGTLTIPGTFKIKGTIKLPP